MILIQKILSIFSTLVVALILSTTAYSGTDCIKKILFIYDKGVYEITPESKRIIKEQERMIRGTAKFLDEQTQYIVPPQDIVIKFDAGNDNPSYALFMDEMFTGVRMYREKPGLTQEMANDVILSGKSILNELFLSKHPKHALAVTAHELGHGIFEWSLRQFFPETRAIFRVHKEMLGPINDRIELLGQRLMRRYWQMDVLVNQALEEKGLTDTAGAYMLLKNDPGFTMLQGEIDKLVKEINELDLEIQRVYQKELAGNGMWQLNRHIIYRGIHELFADFVGVTHSGKYQPKAMFDAIVFAPELKEKNFSYVIHLNRDFSHPDNELSVWGGLIPENILGHVDLHGLFAPSRYFIHETFLQKPEFQRPENLAKLYDIMMLTSVNYVRLLRTKLDWMQTLDEWELNQLFIEIFKDFAKEEGLVF